MKSFRLGLFLGAVLLLQTLCALLCLPLAVLPARTARRLRRDLLVKPTAKLILALAGVKVEAHRLRPPPGQVVYLVNHSSTVDLFVLCALALPDTRFFLSTRTLKYLPITAVALLLGTFHIPPQDRPAQRMACFKKAMRTLRATGESVLLTPEGTRVVDGKLGPFNRGAFHLALSLGVPLQPLYFHIPHEDNAWKGHAVRPCTVTVHQLEPWPTAGQSLEDLEELKASVREAYLCLHRQLHRGEPLPNPEACSPKDGRTS
ncbi:MAG: hypothetical protein A2284_09230 [Deltaproteobacteria bacterium RIFOXYA12_FULL_61_11]|nr:MAG: hypothetical protein A2284_09230 [Deltaproteobacteria bacterium RIFOXYA12_FULL_61_11]